MVNLQTLKDRNVGKMYPLGPDPLPKIDAKNMIFIVRPNLRSMNYVAQIIKHEEKERRGELSPIYTKTQLIVILLIRSQKGVLHVLYSP